MIPVSEADMLLAHEVLDEFLRDFFVPAVFNDGALRRRIAGGLAYVRAEERERCAQVCLTRETELLAMAEKCHAEHRYDDYRRLGDEAALVSDVKDRIRDLADEPVGAQ